MITPINPHITTHNLIFTYFNKSQLNFLLITQECGFIFPSRLGVFRGQYPGYGLPELLERLSILPQYEHIYSTVYIFAISQILTILNNCGLCYKL